MISLKKTYESFKKDESGNFSVMAAATLLVTTFALGVAIDVARLHNVKAKAQAIGDSVALAAAIYMSNNGETPKSSEEGFMEGVPYSARDIGYPFAGAQKVIFTVTYDTANKETSVEIDGSIPASFTKVANYKRLYLNAQAKSKYSEPDTLEPASIMFVLDSSGSMWFDDKPVEPGETEGPDDAVRRMDALKSSLTILNDRLIDLGANDAVNRYIRTGMMTYNHDVVDSTSVNMGWGALTDSEISRMSPSGSTNSSLPMSEAWIQLNSDHSFHLAESGKSPAKFMIFMTDGNNTVGTDTWVEEEDTNHWRRSVTEERCKWKKGEYNCTTYTDWEYYPSDGPSTEEISPPSGSDWEEGKYYLSTDMETQAKCDTMKAHGVRVFSIGFALEAGTYATNEWGESTGRHTVDISPNTKNKSVALLSACASDGDHFILAEDTAALAMAFEKIGNDIAEEVIRLSQ